MPYLRTSALAVLVALACAVPAAAQSVSFGAKGGIAIANVTGDDVDDSSSLTGGIFGAFAQFDATPVFSIQPGIYYHQKGTEFEEDDPTLGTITAEISLNYIQIPILARFSVPTEGRVGFHAFAGPTLSFESSCELSGNVGTTTVSVDCDDPQVQDLIGETKSTQFGGQIGAGLSLSFPGGSSAFVEGAFDRDFTNIPDEEDADVKNQGFFFVAGFAIATGG